ncbi:MAG: hydrogenase expression/formation protein HypE [Xanthomonadales bacterium]|nr:hydrogenase expression/formation protein HypE [Xanthomonadales bacterium]NIX12959.1 hydrogenase expression/formation protein HypE [Xanthomonadales bacterium]
MIDDRYIGLAHGNGGRYMRELIAGVFARHLANPGLDTELDAAPMDLAREGVPFITTDGFIVQPLEFPGGSIGSLAVNGTVNDLAVCGAVPKFLSLNAFIEEGLEVATLDRIVRDLAQAAETAGVAVLAGDTKVVPRGEGGGLYLATTGVGIRPRNCDYALERVQAGDRILVSGPVGDHGVCVMLSRGEFDISGDVVSDCASVLPLAAAAADVPGVRFMRDPTRGGLASVSCEVAASTGLTVRLREAAIPVRDPVGMVCEMLGYDPYYLACEGRVVAFVAADDSETLLAAWQGLEAGREAAIIGVVADDGDRVVLETELLGERILEDLEEDPLPRIC